MKTVKLRVIKDFDDEDLHFTAGQIIEVTKKNSSQFIKAGVADLVKPTKEEIRKGMEEFVEKEAKKQRQQVKNQKETKPKQEESQTEKEDTILDATIIAQEPVLNGDEPKWLIVKKIRKTDANVKDIVENTMNVEEELAFELQQQGQWRCKKCGAIIISNMEQPLECSKEQGGCGRTTTFTRLTEEINPDLWNIPHWEDLKKIDPYQMYEDLVALTKKLVIFNDPIEYKIYALWTISTWKLENWDTVGFPCFIGPPNSGKSTALRLISRLGYRAPKASGVKQAAIPRLCHYWNITLLIDEAHDKLNNRGETAAELLAFIKDSYKRGSVYISCDNNDQKKLVITRNFGFKAFAGERAFKPSVLSRAIVFLMDKATPGISKFSYVEDDIQKIHTQLLNYRFKTDNPHDLGNDFILKGRTREIFESIIATAKHIGMPIDDLIEYAKERDNEIEEELKQSQQYEILEIIKKYADNPHLLPDIERIDFNDLLHDLGWDTTDGGELRKNKQQLGYIFSNLGLKTERSHSIRFFAFENKVNKKRLPQLFKRFGLSEKQQKLGDV